MMILIVSEQQSPMKSVSNSTALARNTVVTAKTSELLSVSGNKQQSRRHYESVKGRNPHKRTNWKLVGNPGCELVAN